MEERKERDGGRQGKERNGKGLFAHPETSVTELRANSTGKNRWDIFLVPKYQPLLRVNSQLKNHHI